MTKNFYSWGNLKRVIVDENITLICDRNLDNFPKHFNGFPQRVFMFQEDPVAVNWDRFPKSFQNSYLGKHRKQNPMTAGYNGLTMAGLVEYINFTPLYIVPKLEADKYAYKDNEGLIKGSGEVSYSKFDIVGMLHFITDNQGMDYEFLHPIFFDNYCVVAPIANSMPLFIASMKCFTLGSWIFIFAIPYISAFILKILNKFNPSHDGLKVSNFVQLTGLLTFVLISITANIKTKSSMQRWLLSGYKRYNEINDLRSLSESSFDIVINSPFMYNIAFGDESRAVDPIMKKLQSKLRLGVDSVYQTVERKACVFRMKSDYEIVNMKIQSQFGEEKLHLVNECPRSYHSTFLVRKGWSFSPLFNRRIINLVESGLIDFWKESSKFALNLNSTIELHEHGIK
uniref:Ionotropic glutamate receptor C-terminal domain-containing protein n=1 Tax=Megaselia scalaris TaxID=36166 RepID=T1H116_MEGSC